MKIFMRAGPLLLNLGPDRGFYFERYSPECGWVLFFWFGSLGYYPYQRGFKIGRC